MTQPAFAAPVRVEVVVTTDSTETLSELTHALVGERLIAYGYTTAPIRATYHKNGTVCDEEHARASLHTRATLVSDIIDRLDHGCSDAVRSVVVTQLVDGRSDCLQWVAHETAATIDHHLTAARRRVERREGKGNRSWGDRAVVENS